MHDFFINLLNQSLDWMEIHWVPYLTTKGTAIVFSTISVFLLAVTNIAQLFPRMDSVKSVRFRFLRISHRVLIWLVIIVGTTCFAYSLVLNHWIERREHDQDRASIDGKLISIDDRTLRIAERNGQATRQEQARNTNEKLQLLEPDANDWGAETARDVVPEDFKARQEREIRSKIGFEDSEEKAVTQQTFGPISLTLGIIKLYLSMYASNTTDQVVLYDDALPINFFGADRPIRKSVKFSSNAIWNLDTAAYRPASQHPEAYFSVQFIDLAGTGSGSLNVVFKPKQECFDIEYKVDEFTDGPGHFYETNVAITNYARVVRKVIPEIMRAQIRRSRVDMKGIQEEATKKILRDGATSSN